MLRTLPLTRDWSPAYRLAAIAVFTLITILSARVTIPLEPVPFTMQPFAVLLAGMILGGRDGFLSQLAYVLLIAAGAPLDARGLGAAAFAGGTGGYLIGFVLAAGVVGWLVQSAAPRVVWRWLAGVVGVAVIYLCGMAWLIGVIGLTPQAAWTGGAAPFIPFDLLKALAAAALTESGRRLLERRA
jgi:biotin transport system substrate-specific component